MSILEFTGAVLLLLLTPGPTNMLMALGGYGRAFRQALRLVPCELAGYLAVIVPVAIIAAPFFTANPSLSVYAKVMASLWVLFLSYRLWFHHKGNSAVQSVAGRDVFVTTLLNPKALIIALVIIPHGALHALLPWLLLFSVLVVFAATGWIVVGRQMARETGPSLKPETMRRIAASCLLLFAAILAGTSLGALRA